MSKEERKPGYVAVVLDNESRAKLRKLAKHSDVKCHHLTLCFKPTEKQWAKYKSMVVVGQKRTLVVTGIAWDDKGQAVHVPETPSDESPYPHVTISCAEGTKPVYSIELLRNSDTAGTIKPYQMVLTGVVKFVRL